MIIIAALIAIVALLAMFTSVFSPMVHAIDVFTGFVFSLQFFVGFIVGFIVCVILVLKLKS